MIVFSTFLLALFLTIALVPLFRRLAYALHVVDLPQERKVHSAAMPKTGGLAMAVGLAVPLFLWAPRIALFPFLMIALLIVVGAGFLDDVMEFGSRAKFCAQIMAALVVVVFGGVKIRNCGVLLPEGMVLGDWLAIPLSVFVLVGVTNAINLADGLDGLAGGISVLIFVVLGSLGLQSADSFVLITAAAVVGALFGFLRYNTFPATIFMGDAGSQMLGFLAGVLSLWMSQSDAVLSPFMPLLLLGFPILDTLTVMLERLYHGRSPFTADKNHFHHRLMRFGFFHSEAVLMVYALQAVMVGAAFWLRYFNDWVILLVYGALASVILLAFFFGGRYKWSWRQPKTVDAQALQQRIREHYQLIQLIKFLFRALQVNLGLVLLILVLSIGSVPDWLALLAPGALLLFVGVRFFRPERAGMALRWSVYLIVPTLVYLCELAHSNAGDVWFGLSLEIFCNLSFLSLVTFTLLVLRFTRRAGYRSTPLDFLILLVSFLVLAVIPEGLFAVSLGLVVVKVFAVFFAFEVVLEESRSPNRWLELTVALILLTVGVKRLELWFTGLG
ncbi:MAG: undecaprenyl/decaprenyl-phosphate alpha-N-acetylglucosaminyl 1-phosphate transferase [Deltaproteobacteria bacterium]|nr:undecaprenyl/decaprenyl-phosphate alpha-N-acetylglucosaminyl 1-phosphate transferase [Deltaproteobacteria bacterium]